MLALPLRPGRVDAIFAAGLVAHVPDPAPLLADLAEWARPGGRLALFHPIGRAALAARQQRELSSTDLLAPVNVRPLLAGAAGFPISSTTPMSGISQSHASKGDACRPDHCAS